MSSAPMTQEAPPARTHRGLAGWVGRPWFWIVFLAFAFSWPIARTLRLEMPAPLPVLGTIPEFGLIDAEGRSFGSQQLQGRVWVANFIFTRCPTVCPAFTAKMAKIQHRARNLGEAFHLVSFSVDPEYDTPERLLAYGKQHRASPRMWSFLTGSPEAVKKTVVDGLKVSMGKGGAENDFLSIFHGSHFVLVDAKMRIRGYYDSSKEESVSEVLHAAGLLVNRGD